MTKVEHVQTCPVLSIQIVFPNDILIEYQSFTQNTQSEDRKSKISIS